MHDEGWNLPDKRHQWILENGHRISIHIVRNYKREEFDDEDGYMDFDVYWEIKENGKQVFRLPQGRHEEDAIAIATILYPEINNMMELVD